MPIRATAYFVIFKTPMKPIAIFQHTEVGAPGTIIPILESMGRSCRVIRIVDGEDVPAEITSFGGLVFMGGYMGVHDDLPWIAVEKNVIRQAVALGIPVAGHCLGSQLLASAMDAQVKRLERPEIGWQKILVDDNATANDWWGHASGTHLLTFQWHQDTFDLPTGAVRIASSQFCENQAYVLHGIHLGVQSHLEMTPALIELSLERNGDQIDREIQLNNPGVTSIPETRRELNQRTHQMTGSLERLYRRWVQSCS